MNCTSTHERRRELTARESIDGEEVWSTKASCGAFWPCQHVTPAGYRPGQAFDPEPMRRKRPSPDERPTTNTRLQTERDVHIPSPEAGTRPLCGAHRGFIVTHFDILEVTCDPCLRLSLDEAIARGEA